MVLLELEELVVSTTDGGFVRSLGDEDDEEVANVLAVDGLLVHRLLRVDRVGRDEAEPGEEAVGNREHPHEPPQGREREGIVRPPSGRLVDDPDDGESGDEEDVGEPSPALRVEEAARPHGLLVGREVGRPARRVELGKDFGVGGIGDGGTSGRRAPVHNSVEVAAEVGVLRDGAIADAANRASRTVDDHVGKVADQLHRKGAGVVGLGDEETVPDGLAELESDAVEEVVGDPTKSKVSAQGSAGGETGEPGDEEVEHEADDVRGDDVVPVRVAPAVEMEDEVRHQAVDGQELHQVEPVRDLSDPDKDTPAHEPLHRVTELDPDEDGRRGNPASASSSRQQVSTRKKKEVRRTSCSSTCTEARGARRRCCTCR